MKRVMKSSSKQMSEFLPQQKRLKVSSQNPLALQVWKEIKESWIALHQPTLQAKQVFGTDYDPEFNDLKLGLVEKNNDFRYPKYWISRTSPEKSYSTRHNLDRLELESFRKRFCRS